MAWYGDSEGHAKAGSIGGKQEKHERPPKEVKLKWKINYAYEKGKDLNGDSECAG